ncbi:hypothetical protein WMY93_023553 [Mugilogobius chulae]|uniref:Uncharacterized protein n=1 Tax=Mugilogobius chulae TaxID=88201 RepID=A0AAW0N929_9GOBI
MSSLVLELKEERRRSQCLERAFDKIKKSTRPESDARESENQEEKAERRHGSEGKAGGSDSGKDQFESGEQEKLMSSLVLQLEEERRRSQCLERAFDKINVEHCNFQKATQENQRVMEEKQKDVMALKEKLEEVRKEREDELQSQIARKERLISESQDNLSKERRRTRGCRRRWRRKAARK